VVDYKDMGGKSEVRSKQFQTQTLSQVGLVVGGKKKRIEGERGYKVFGTGGPTNRGGGQSAETTRMNKCEKG